MPEEDEQYKKATTAVGDAMRTDVLGPKVCQVLNEHLPTNELLEKKIVKFIENSSQVKTALSDQISSNQSVRLSRWVERIALVAGSGVAYWIGQYLIGQLDKS